LRLQQIENGGNKLRRQTLILNVVAVLALTAFIALNHHRLSMYRSTSSPPISAKPHGDPKSGGLTATESALPSTVPFEGLTARGGVPSSEAEWAEFLARYLKSNRLRSPDDADAMMNGLYLDSQRLQAGTPSDLEICVYEVAPHRDLVVRLLDGVLDMSLVTRAGGWRKPPDESERYAWFGPPEESPTTAKEGPYPSNSIGVARNKDAGRLHALSKTTIPGTADRPSVPHTEADWYSYLRRHVIIGMSEADLDIALNGLYEDRAIVGLGGLSYLHGVVYNIGPDFDVGFLVSHDKARNARLIHRTGAWRKDADGFVEKYIWFD
jgi:hypothetical protein